MQRIQTRKVKAKKRPTAPKPNMVRKQIIIGVTLVMGIALILTGVYFGSRVESKQITGVRVVGGQTIPHAQIEQLVTDTLVGNFYRLVPRTFTWTYPRRAIEDAVLSSDRVKNVQVSLEQKQVVVVFEEHIPHALWCDESDVDCLFIDRTALAFAPAPELSGGAFVRYAELGRAPERGTTAFAAEYMRENESFVELLETQLGLYVTHILKSGDYDIDYTVSGGGVVKVSQTMPLTTSFRNLESILQSEDFIHLEPGKFQYIDLRFGDKVFVNEELPSASVSTSTASTT